MPSGAFPCHKASRGSLAGFVGHCECKTKPELQNKREEREREIYIYIYVYICMYIHYTQVDANTFLRYV